VIDVELARRLKESGLRWDPAAGDRFAIPKAGLVGQVFTLADMTIDLQHLPSGPVLAFNGTTEWALDSVEPTDAVWLPAEHQLRSLLRGCFRCLRVVPAEALSPLADDDPDGTVFEVVVDLPGVGERQFQAAGAEDAYAMAVLDLLRLVAA
jgi:hypothetical protein